MLIKEISERWAERGISTRNPVIYYRGRSISLEDIAGASGRPSIFPPARSVVAHVGDFTPRDISTLLGLIDEGCIIAPLTVGTARQHEEFFDIIGAEWIISEGEARKRPSHQPQNSLITQLKERSRPGLILFSSGTTGVPKASLHDLSKLLDKFRQYNRPVLKTLAFLLFDHIGGINTLLHTLYNAGTIHVPLNRRPTSVMKQVEEEGINLIPTTPSFLRLALVEGAFDGRDLSSLRIVTYGTESMDQTTLDRLNQALPEHVDIRQTYGMSELGIFPVRNRSKRELWIRIADPNIDIEVRDGVLWVRSPHRMLGYLNAASPFDENGWFNTRDLVETGGDYFRIMGRTDDVINVGGLKVQPRDVEDAVYNLPEVCYAKASGEDDPFLGQHITLSVQLVEGVTISKRELRAKLSRLLDRDRMPHRIRFQQVAISERFKRE